MGPTTTPLVSGPVTTAEPAPTEHPSSVVLDAGLSARLTDLAARHGVPREVAAVVAAALLVRRWTGRVMVPVRCPDTGYLLDLTGDRPVREVLAGAAVSIRRTSRTEDCAAPSAGPAEPSSAPVEPFADGIELATRTDVSRWEIRLGDCPAELVEPLLADLVTLLAALAGDDGVSTGHLLPVSAYERRRASRWAELHGGAAGARPERAPGDTIPAAFAAQLRRTPDHPAVLADDGCLTYRELASAVVATATVIRSTAGTRPGGQVALLCRHGAGTVVALLAALAAGRAYVPLDPAFPAHRLARILADSDADVLLTDAGHAGQADRLRELAGRPGLRIVPVAPAVGPADLADLAAGLATPAGPDDPAYLLYTSGSTGAPKGVVQSHRNVLFGVGNHIRNFALTPADRTSVLTSFGYDMAVTDTFSALLSGAAAVPVDIRSEGLGHLARTLAMRGVTVYHSTPTVYRYLCASLGPDATLPAIRAVLLGGEEVTRHDVELARRHFAPDAVFVNGYGTTEISFAAQDHLPADAPLAHAVVPIGHPLDGIDVLLLDPAGRPTCLTGEVVVRSAHVALGYWRLPELTAGRFGEHDGVRTYRTGDLARRLPDGRLVFLGRADRLVKIRGHRVELGEVEAALAALPGVGHAAVVARPRTGGAGAGDKEIIGYVVPSPDASVDPTALRAGLAIRLPDFMLPRTVVAVDALPMGVTGKLDVAALPPPPPGRFADAAGQDPLETIIAASWCEVLGLDRVGRETAFVDLGGHSLLMALVQQRLEATLNRRVPLVRLFEFPTVAGLAAHLRAGEPVDGPGAEDDALLRAAGRMRRRRRARSGETV
ncbi:non-ribosomal peptide synthetase [Micromonospora sp. 4G57]|uniref:Non-ribosomal peptide synthetase n=1 Tax=Micromonospora sicca TaxID=2202420 RepID=A0ABU5J941_9ACTN|nr:MULTISPECIES: non-ribosomal peptide synthetase [unclassified Micromonospora]MDZ5442295.1 non-ribosomal peptide synthetase [Micromonospora sp. 4G57]MDZ5489100.1 non-ribosomal peptide synthetase [Micromonospora sp. 4G53]